MRDLRLDLFRGLAVYMIFVDHVNGDPLARFTYRTFGFSDAAELFVFLSGIACGIAYGRVFERGGLTALTTAIVRRLARIYVFYALSSIATILLVTTAINHGVFTEFLGITTGRPLAEIASSLFLVSPPHLCVILILYIILAAVVVPAIVIAPAPYRRLVLAASALIWFLSQIFSSYFAARNHSLIVFFNPVAWQFLFALGVILGTRREPSGVAIPSFLQARWLKVSAWAIVIGALLIKILSFRSIFGLAEFAAIAHWASDMKWNLSPIRLIHFLSVAYLVATYIPVDSSILNWRVLQPIILTGMHSLEIYSLSIVLDAALGIVVLAHPPSTEAQIAVDIISFLLMAFTAAALAQHRAERRKTAAKAAAPKGAGV